ncbi:AN1-type zinc finger domain-containing protein [Halorubrum coriense]|uniref:AN1-type zinc finger domain-containing protein n=1 Tax=Halorubrum coriense TaxID=64713 RepID=UPI00373AE3CA
MKGCGRQFCADHRSPEEHDCIRSRAEEAERELKPEDDGVEPRFKNEFRLSNVESSSSSSGGGRWNRTRDVPTEECVNCGKRPREHEISGCPHCGEPFCGERAVDHWRSCEEREGDEKDSATDIAADYQERTRNKQQERKTRTDKSERERVGRFSSPDVNPDGSLSHPDRDEDIRSISSSDDDVGNPADSGSISKITVAILTVALTARLWYLFAF